MSACVCEKESVGDKRREEWREGGRKEGAPGRRKGGQEGGRRRGRRGPSRSCGGGARGGGGGERKRGRTIGPKRLGQTSGWSGGRAPRAGAPGTRARLPTGFCAWEVLPAALRPRDSRLRSGAWDSGLGCPLPRCSSMTRRPAWNRPARFANPCPPPGHDELPSLGPRGRALLGCGCSDLGWSLDRVPGAGARTRPRERTDAKRPSLGASGKGSGLPTQTRPTGWATPADTP